MNKSDVGLSTLDKYGRLIIPRRLCSGLSGSLAVHKIGNIMVIEQGNGPLKVDADGRIRVGSRIIREMGIKDPYVIERDGGRLLIYEFKSKK